MENDVLYNRIMNVVHEEYGIYGRATVITVPEGAETVGLGMSFNDLKNAALNGEIPTFCFIMTAEQGDAYVLFHFSTLVYSEENQSYAIYSDNSLNLENIEDPDAELFISPIP